MNRSDYIEQVRRLIAHGRDYAEPGRSITLQAVQDAWVKGAQVSCWNSNHQRRAANPFSLQETNFRICSLSRSPLPGVNIGQEVPPRGWVCEFGLSSPQ
jgi:hypothetical protein